MFYSMSREFSISLAWDNVWWTISEHGWGRHKGKWGFQPEMLFSLTFCLLSWLWLFAFLLAAAFHTLPYTLLANHPSERIWADVSLPTLNRVPVLLTLPSSTMSPHTLISLVIHPMRPPWKPYSSECLFHFYIEPLESISNAWSGQTAVPNASARGLWGMGSHSWPHVAVSERERKMWLSTQNLFCNTFYWYIS